MARRAVVYFLAFWMTLMVPAVWAADSKESLVKAAFIYNFVKFVEWPGERAVAQLPKIDICVLGSSPISGAGSVFKAASTAKLTLALDVENSAKAAAAHCHILFISSSEEERLGDILAVLKGQPVLTVSDIEGFAGEGGMIGFVNSDNKIKIEVNTKPVTAAGMRVDAQLLEIAQKVIDK